MLKRSFIHIPGIGPAKEQSLWEDGVRDWSDLGRSTRSERVTEFLNRSEKAYESRDLRFFHNHLPRNQLWRMIPEFFDDIAYLDIETTGLAPPPVSQSTTVTFCFRGQLYQEHDPRSKERLIRKILSECSLLVSYFGEVFDVPLLSREFGIAFDKAHIDLCFWLKRHGYGGGLKHVQKHFPEIPARGSLDIDGFDAVRLWSLHRRGVVGALETLLTYNAEDTVVLEPLLKRAYLLEMEKRPELALPHLPDRAVPEILSQVNPTVYSMLRGATKADEQAQ
jgi:uncharacterized protein